jgi:hypothetical protein
VIGAVLRKIWLTTDIAANAEVRGESGRLLPVILTSNDPNAPLAVMIWVFPVALGSATSFAFVASKPVPDKATAAATFAFLGYRSAASRAVPSKCVMASVRLSKSMLASAGDPRQPAGG